MQPSAEALARARELESIQDLLYHITEDNYGETVEKLMKFPLLSTPEGVLSLAHILRVGSRVRASKIELFTKLVMDVNTTLPNFKNALLMEIFERQYQNIGRYYFLYQLVKNGFYEVQQILDKIHEYGHRGIACEQRALYVWFAPELNELEPTLKISVPNDEDLDEEEAAFFNNLESLSADNWKVMKEIRDLGINENPIFKILMNDDVESLSAIEELDVNATFVTSCYNRYWQLQDSPSLMHAAAYFGAAKCIDYLIAKGAKCDAVDERGRKVSFFIMYNGHVDLIDKIPDQDYSSALSLTAGHHQNDARKWLIEHNHPSVDPGLIADRFGTVLHQACGTGNMGAVIYCLEKGVDVNAKNAVCFTFIEEKLAFIMHLSMVTLILLSYLCHAKELIATLLMKTTRHRCIWLLRHMLITQRLRC